MKKNYILDTNIYLTDSNSLYNFGNNDIIVPFKVLEEIDKHKKRQDVVGSNARRIIRNFDDLRSKGSLIKGVRIDKGKGLLIVKNFYNIFESSKNPLNLDSEIHDNEILLSAYLVKEEDKKRKTIIVTKDINLRVKADTLGIESIDYEPELVIRGKDELYSGFTTHLVDDQIIDRFYSGDPVFIDREERKLFPNQFIMLISNSNDKKTAIAKFKNHSSPLQKVDAFKKGLWGVKPRNKEQMFALNLLTDDSIQIVTLLGASGTGKTLVALAAGLGQVMENRKQSIYKRMIVSKPVEPVGKDIGFLPGSIQEKMAPWMAPIQDNLRNLLGNDDVELDKYIYDGIIEVEAITYIRGRSISNSYIIIDEVQNLGLHEIKTIITRVGEGSKLVLLGDVTQIDNVYLNDVTNALTQAIEKFKSYDISGHITLKKGERSKLATLAAKIL